jgi:hypothetical protein
LHASIPRDYASAIGFRHFGGSDAKIIFAGCNRSAGDHHANFARSSAERAGCGRYCGWYCSPGCHDDRSGCHDDNAECGHRFFQSAVRLQEERVEEAG